MIGAPAERLSIERLQHLERLLRLSNPLSEAACRRLTLVATVLGSSMASVTAISVALPAIRTDFGIGFGAQQWIMLSYSLALASLYLVAGALDDRLGRRRMFIVGTAGFALASSLAGIAHDNDGRIASSQLQERFDNNIVNFMDLVEAATHYPCVKRAWVEYLGEIPDPAIDRVE